MKVIPVMSTKGGVGKSKVCVTLGRALLGRGKKVGILDVDWSAPKIHIELGLKEGERLQLENGVGDIIKPTITPEGFKLVSSAFLFPHDQAISMDEKSSISDILEITSPGVVDWGDIDYLIMDTPPTTAKFVQAALQIKDLYGVVLVAQPATLALADLLRTVSLLRDLQVPTLGLIGNQVYVVCPHGERVELYDLGEEELKLFCTSQGIPYLGAIPHVLPKQGRPLLDGMVDRILGQAPVLLSQKQTSSIPYKLLIAVARKTRRTDG